MLPYSKNKELSILRILFYILMTFIIVGISHKAIANPSIKTTQTANTTVNTTANTKENPQKPAPSSTGTIHADHVQYGKTKGSIIATGNVKLIYQNVELDADRVVWDKANNKIEAHGNVMLIKDNNIMKSKNIHMSVDFQHAIMDAMTAKLENNSYITAKKTTRVAGKSIEFDSPVYTLCRPDPKKTTQCPIWRLRASSGMQDQTDKSYSFYNPRIELFGVPVVYFPYIYVDGEIQRETGFLTPSLGSTSSIGQYVTLPFYWDISNDKDFTVLPSKYITNSQFFTQAVYRQHLGNGLFTLSGSITKPANYKKGGLDETNPWRWDINGSLKYNINDKWRMGANLMLVSDDTFLTVYGLNSGVYSTIFLPSKIYMERLDEHSYLKTQLTYFRDIRNEYTRTDSAYLLGKTNYIIKTEPDKNDVYYTIDTGYTMVKRRDKISTYRLHASLNLNKSVISSWGTRLDGNISLTGIGYHEGLEDINYNPQDTKLDTLLFTPTASLKVSHPLVRPLGEKNDIVEILEPIVNLKLGLNHSIGSDNPNEDSQSQELDNTNIFRDNRFSGIDRIENGTRVDYGFNWGFFFPNGRYLQSFIGQSYRFNKISKYSAGSGLDNRRSDYVGSLEIVPSDYLSLRYQYRIDSKSLLFHRSEGSISVGPSFLRLSADYIKYDIVQSDPVTNELYRQLSESVKGSLDIHVFDHWRSYTTADFTINPTTSYLIGTQQADQTAYKNKLTKITETISYNDECFDLSLGITRTYYSDRDIKPETSILVLIQLKSLGSINFNRVLAGGTNDNSEPEPDNDDNNNSNNNDSIFPFTDTFF